MKSKLFIVLLLLVLLTGCNGNKNGNIIIDLTVCEDECSIANSEFWDTYENTYLGKISAYKKLIAPNNVELSTGSFTDGVWDKTDFLRTDPITNNDYIIIDRGVEALNENLVIMSFFLLYCENDTTCEIGTRYDVDVISNITYGYNDDSGFYSYTGTNSLGETLTSSFKYSFDESYGSFEFYVFYPETNSFEYESYHNGTYSNIESSPSTNMLRYTEFNVDSKEAMKIVFDEKVVDCILYYDPVESLAYEYFGFGSYSITDFDNMELTAKLSSYNIVDKSELDLSINFHFIENWDEAEISSLVPSIKNVNLMLDGVDVYSDYNLVLRKLNRGYSSVIGELSILENESNSFEFPTLYTGNRTFSDMLTELESFKAMESPLAITEITKADVENDANNILKYLESETK